MHVVVSKRDLLRVLTRCHEVADKKSTMPALGNVLLEVVGTGELRLAATDLLLAVSGKIPARIEQGGAVALGARDLFERVRMMPEGDISIVVTESSATAVRAVGAARRYSVRGMPGDEFPTLPEPEEGAQLLSLSVEALSGLIATTQFSISGDETRMHLNSALFECEGDRVRMVTTDGHRLSKRELLLEQRQSDATMLIPLKGVVELKRLCDEARADAGREGDRAGLQVQLTQSGPNAFFQLAGFQFSVKLVDGQFHRMSR
jgi:DNA polymerase-3 subunit beta